MTMTDLQARLLEAQEALIAAGAEVNDAGLTPDQEAAVAAMADVGEKAIAAVRQLLHKIG